MDTLRATRSRRWAILLLLTFAAISSAAAGAASPAARGDWPRWRGPGFDGSAACAGCLSGPFQMQVRWRRSLGSGYSGVVVAAGHAVTMYSDGEVDHLVSLDADSGTTGWTVPIAPTYRGREGSNDGPVSTPAIADGMVYAVGPRGDVLAVSVIDGSVLWRIDLTERFGASPPHWGFGGSPLVVEELLALPVGGEQAGTIIALNRRTGEFVWQAGSDPASYQSPMLVTLAGETLILAAGDTDLFAVEPSTGVELGRIPHQGDDFYRRIINPVKVGEGAFLLTQRSDEATLIRLERRDHSVAATDIWKTPHLKRNYATPVYHDGTLYGYSGSLLTSVDARTGSLNWKSRLPGNGFPILVDDRLIILTKEGTLHVVDASPEAYRERARLTLFDGLAWTPPSFAGGRAYARDSFMDVACVEIIPLDEPDAAVTEPSPEGDIPESLFGRFVHSLGDESDRAARVTHFLREQESFPLVEDGGIVHLVYRGEPADLVVRGDMLETLEVQPMHRVEGTNLYYYSFRLQPDARIDYQFLRDLEPIPDPRNPRLSDSFLYPGKVSQLRMPQAGSVPDPPKEVHRGRVESFELHSPRVRVGAKIWGGARQVRVYLPPGYDDTSRRFPTIYVLYGERMFDAGFGAVLDATIGKGLPPVIVVFEQSISPYEYARTQREAHGRMMVDQLVPRIDDAYRTVPTAAARVILGVDEAGVSALELGLREPAVFGGVVTQSVYPVGAGGEDLLRTVDEAPLDEVRIRLDWGLYDQRSSVRRIDVPSFNRQLQARLEARGLRVTAREWSDGSDLGLWMWRALLMLQDMFAEDQAMP